MQCKKEFQLASLNSNDSINGNNRNRVIVVIVVKMVVVVIRAIMIRTGLSVILVAMVIVVITNGNNGTHRNGQNGYTGTPISTQGKNLLAVEAAAVAEMVGDGPGFSGVWGIRLISA